MRLLIFCVLLAFAEKFSVIDFNLIRGLFVIGIILYIAEEFKRK